MPKKSIKNITTSTNTFAPTLVNSYPLPDPKFNGNRLVNNNIFIPRKATNLYIFLHSRYMVKRFKYRLQIK